MLYLDTSLIVAALTEEDLTERAQDWLGAQDGGTLAVSHWSMTEVSSALGIKLRTGQIDAGQRAAALAMFNRLSDESLTVFTVSEHHFRVAARFLDQAKLGLRAGDALHLAVASDHGATVHTLDERMLAAGPALGIVTRHIL